MVHVELVVAKLITMGLGFLIAQQAYRGYRVHGSRPMLFVAIGFVFISVGAIVEGLLFNVFEFSIFLAGTVQTTIVAIGMVVILYSLYGQMPTDTD
ncbi:MAG: hypothetical protein ABEH66_03580 [Halobacteriales archaeon]